MRGTESINITDPQIEIGRINQNGAFEHFLLNLAISFVNLPCERIDEEVVRALEMTGQFTGVDRSYVMEYDFEDRVVNNTHEWCAEGVEPMINSLQRVPMDGIDEDWLDVHLRGDIVHVPDVATLPEDAPLRRILEPQGIITLVAVPMIYHGNCLGFVGFDAVKNRIKWTSEQLVLVRLLAELFTNASMGLRANQQIQRERLKTATATRMLLSSVRATGTAVWELNFDLSVVHLVSGWNRLLNVDWDGKEISLNDFLKHVHPEDIHSIHAALGRSKRATEETASVDFRMRINDSHWYYLRAWWVAEVAGDNQEHTVTRFCGGTMNVTDEIRLARKHQLLSAISARFVDGESFDKSLGLAMSDLRDHFDAEYVTLLFHDLSYRPARPTDTSCLSSQSEEVSFLWAGITSDKDGHLSELRNGRTVHIHHSTKTSTGNGSGNSLGIDYFRSVLFVPISVGRHFVGCLVTTYRDFYVRIPDSHTDVMRSSVEILGGAIGRIRAEQSLRDSEKNHRLSLSCLEDTVYLSDAAGRITFINPSGSRLFGYPCESFIGRRIHDFIEMDYPLPELYEKKNTLPFITRARTRDGRLLNLSIRISRISASDDDPACNFGSIRDITLQQAWEESLITEKIRIENINDANSMYISNLSHELRTPIHGVIGMLDLMMRSGELRPRDLQLAEAAHRSGKSLLRLLDDILDIAKIERGAIRLHPEQLDFPRILQSITMMFEDDASSRGIALDICISPKLPKTLFLDELRIRQVLSNLLSNAIKYTKKGFVRLSANLTRDISGNECLSILVEDSGIGIADDNLPRLFKPFVRGGKHSIQSAEDGSGLGLSITKMIVERMGGNISIYSKLGIGTRVKVKVPLLESKVHPRLGIDSAAPRIIQESLSGMSVLIAEDNEINRILAEEHLRSLTCDVYSVENGKEAVAMCMERMFDVVLMDITMPVMDGFEACRRILLGTYPTHPCPVIIGCTANASEAAISRCLDCGMRSVITKPFTRDDLFQALHPFLQTPAETASDPEDIQEEAPTLDDATMQRLEIQFRGARGRLHGIIQRFMESSQKQVSGIRSSAYQGDWPGCGRTAHTLRGGASIIGAIKLTNICASIENAIGSRSQNGDDFNSYMLRMIDDLVLCSVETIQALDSYIHDTTM
jgi:PAS domain S-box-containing protein